MYLKKKFIRAGVIVFKKKKETEKVTQNIS